MTAEDVAAAERLSDVSYHDVDLRTLPPGAPVPALRTPDRAEAWARRTRHLLDTDPGGCWVAERDGELLGFAVSFTRELMWLLGSYAVAPGAQDQGLGRVLLGAAMEHGRGCLRGMLAASADPRAARRYRMAGFELHPQMFATGVVDRSALPVLERVRDGGSADFDLMDSVDRRTRGAAHGPDHAVLLESFRLLVVDRAGGSGYAYADADGSPVLVAATSRRVAADLMWESLAGAGADDAVSVRHITAANLWAVDVALAARLTVRQGGYLCLRHLAPPAPYVHHGSLL
jgi:GNAT superfamily N-acetyltransferase